MKRTLVTPINDEKLMFGYVSISRNENDTYTVNITPDYADDSQWVKIDFHSSTRMEKFEASDSVSPVDRLLIHRNRLKLLQSLFSDLFELSENGYEENYYGENDYVISV